MKKTIIAVLLIGMIGSCKKESTNSSPIDEKINIANTATYAYPGGESYYTGCSGPGYSCGTGDNCEYTIPWGGGGVWWVCKTYIKGIIINDDGDEMFPLLMILDSAENDTDLYASLVDTRDNYLLNFAAGKQYINFFQMLRQVAIHKGIPIVGTVREAAFGWESKKRLDSMKSGDWTTIIVDSSYRAEGVFIINAYKDECSDLVFKRACDFMIADLNRFVGWSRYSIYEYYNNNPSLLDPHTTEDLLPIVE